MAETTGGKVKASVQWTPEQLEWLQSESQRLGLDSVAAVARLIVQAAMSAEIGCRQCPIHCQHSEVRP